MNSNVSSALAISHQTKFGIFVIIQIAFGAGGQLSSTSALFGRDCEGNRSKRTRLWKYLQSHILLALKREFWIKLLTEQREAVREPWEVGRSIVGRAPEVVLIFSLDEMWNNAFQTRRCLLLYAGFTHSVVFKSNWGINYDIQAGARNVIPLIVHITHFYYYKNIWHLVHN